MKLSNEEKKRIGELGESIAAKYFKMQGHHVEMAEDQYDMHKDMLVDGVKTEIKTETYYRSFPVEGLGYHKAFTVPIKEVNGKVYENQLTKCLNVDRLIFIGRPNAKDPYIRIYEAPPVGKRKYYKHANYKDGRTVAGFLVEDMKEIFVATAPHLVTQLMEKSY
jgi:hypothetical protein